MATHRTSSVPLFKRQICRRCQIDTVRAGACVGIRTRSYLRRARMTTPSNFGGGTVSACLAVYDVEGSCVVSGDDWSCLNTLKGHAGTVWQCSFNTAGNGIASCSDDFSVRIWMRAQGAAKHNYIPSHTISGIASQSLYRFAHAIMRSVLPT